MTQPIPIRNIYYLLCYAWNRLAEGEIVDVSKVPSTEIADLFATVLISGTNHLLRRGLDQGYQTFEGELSSVRGRIDISRTARRMLSQHGKAYCYYDEFNVNTLPNRVIKSAIRFLAGVSSLDVSLKKKLVVLYRNLGGIDDIPFSQMAFRKIQLHANNRFYRFLLNVCEMIKGAWLVDEATGDYKFRDFIREERQMALIFQDFVFNFYRIECQELKVSKDRIYWNAKSDGDPDLVFLPSMNTDITLRSTGRTIVIDTKFYKETMQSYYGSETIHSGNIYQLFSYLKNMEARGGQDARAKGILLYPTVNKNFNITYEISGHEFSVFTIDLAQDWQGIRKELIQLVN